MNIIGKKFGRLLVISYSKNLKGQSYWNCKCDCGRDKIAMRKTLVNGGTTSCGCFQKERVHQTQFHDISGKKFGNLTAVSSYYDSRTYWKCLCDCGKETTVDAAKLKSGHTKSCGCLHDYVAKIRAIKRNKLMNGDEHPRWRSDLTDEERARRKECREADPKLNRWREKVYRRDDYTCQNCKDDRGGNLNAHHIYSWSHYPSLRYITNNGITLCERCHKDFHHTFGIKKNTKKQFTEWRRVNDNLSPTICYLGYVKA
jgi:5-methylcytosine-specific restriction endonuclease McrA